MEIGATEKKASEGRLKVALLYPGTYKEAISSLGHLIVYELLNENPDVVAHRFTLESPFSIEENLPLKAYDVIVVSVHFEPQLPKLLSYLSRYGVPLRRESRETRIILGGPGVWNPYPSSAFADGYFIGDGEDTVPKLPDFVHLPPEDWKMKGFYSPWNDEPTSFSYHDFSRSYHHILSDSTAYGRFPLFLEVNRGCRFACRFCLIGWTQPQRNRKLSQIVEIMEEHFSRGAERVVFMGSDVLAHPHIDRILDDLAYFRIPFSLPSTRLDKLTDEFLSILGKAGVKTLTVAPETAYWKRKLFIAKLIDNESVVDAAKRARSYGIRKLKLYFMVGYPGTTEEEVKALIDLVKEARRYIMVTGTVSVFVPKPYTPFQYLPMERIEETARWLKLIKKETHLDVMNPKRAALQALLSIGDRRISELLLRAYKNFNYHYWKRAASEMGINIDDYLYGSRETPWMEKIRTYVHPRGIKEGFEVALEVMN